MKARINLVYFSSFLSSTLFLYLLVASAGALVDLLVFASLVYLWDVNYLYASIPAFFLATFTNYKLSIIYIFQSLKRFTPWMELVVIYAVSGTGLLWHLVLLYSFIDLLSLHVMLGKVLALGLVFFWNYLVRKFYIFASNTKTIESLDIAPD